MTTVERAKLIRDTVTGKTPAQLNAAGLRCPCRNCQAELRAMDFFRGVLVRK